MVVEEHARQTHAMAGCSRNRPSSLSQTLLGVHYGVSRGPGQNLGSWSLVVSQVTCTVRPRETEREERLVTDVKKSGKQLYNSGRNDLMGKRDRGTEIRYFKPSVWLRAGRIKAYPDVFPGIPEWRPTKMTDPKMFVPIDGEP